MGQGLSLPPPPHFGRSRSNGLGLLLKGNSALVTQDSKGMTQNFFILLSIYISRKYSLIRKYSELSITTVVIKRLGIVGSTRVAPNAQLVSPLGKRPRHPGRCARQKRLQTYFAMYIPEPASNVLYHVHSIYSQSFTVYTVMYVCLKVWTGLQTLQQTE